MNICAGIYACMYELSVAQQKQDIPNEHYGYGQLDIELKNSLLNYSPGGEMCSVASTEGLYSSI